MRWGGGGGEPALTSAAVVMEREPSCDMFKKLSVLSTQMQAHVQTPPFVATTNAQAAAAADAAAAGSSEAVQGLGGRYGVSVVKASRRVGGVS